MLIFKDVNYSEREAFSAVREFLHSIKLEKNGVFTYTLFDVDRDFLVIERVTDLPNYWCARNHAIAKEESVCYARYV